MSKSSKEKQKAAKPVSLFSYQWSHEDSDDEGLIINLYGLLVNNADAYVRISGFQCWAMIGLPAMSHEWEYSSVVMVKQALESACAKENIRVCRTEIIQKEKLYNADVDVDRRGGVTYRKHYFVQMFFDSSVARRRLAYRLARPIRVADFGDITVKCHEANASPVLQFTSSMDIPPSGWITGEMHRVHHEDDDRRSRCSYEFKADFSKLSALKDCNSIVHPLVLSMDIETNSTNPTRMPNPAEPRDDVRMISCVFHRQGSDESTWTKYLLTQGHPDPERVGADIKILNYTTEAELLQGYAQLVREKNPQIITGFNIFGFDFPFMIQRSQSNYTHNVFTLFSKQGVIEGREGVVKKIKWSSSAFKTQEFTYLDAEGRLFIDMYPMVQREFKLEAYNLKTVSTYFLGETKDPLTPKGIFKCFRLNTPTALGVVGKYCVQDAYLVNRLFEKLNVWTWVSEKANVCNVPIFTLYSSGQQITVFSQVYKYCLQKNMVVEGQGYEAAEDETYSGAFVFPPKPGLYDNVTSFDFSSLYPTTIIAYNIDYHTLVLDPKIPDSMCNVIEWEDHIGCEHDKTERKTKVKKVICDKAGPKKYRFLKEPKGVLPTILVNLLDARKAVNRVIDELKDESKAEKDPVRKAQLNSEITVLDKRQLSLKVSANSMYGAMGVTRGYLPFMPGAMCTTAMGRKSIEKAMHYIKTKYNGELVYGDTDSCYVHFTHTEKPAELYDFCERVEEEMLALFPKPMKLAFEGKIYWRFFILTKKRYMALTCDRDGKVSSKTFNRGVILSRRDNSEVVRNLYLSLIMKIFYRENECFVINSVFDGLLKIFQRVHPDKEFRVTKSVNDADQYASKLPVYTLKKETDVAKLEKTIGMYTGKLRQNIVSKILNKTAKSHGCAACSANGLDAKRCTCKGACEGCKQEAVLKQTRPDVKLPSFHPQEDRGPRYLEKLDAFAASLNGKIRQWRACTIIGVEGQEHNCSACKVNGIDAERCECHDEEGCPACENERRYKMTVLPPQVQLAERMRLRGKPVQPGSRMEFIVTMGPGMEEKLADKMEDIEYFREHSEIIHIDPYYYLKFAVNPLDQMLETAYGNSDVITYTGAKYLPGNKQTFWRKNMVQNFYKLMKKRFKVLQELKQLFAPEIVFED